MFKVRTARGMLDLFLVQWGVKMVGGERNLKERRRKGTELGEEVGRIDGGKKQESKIQKKEKKKGKVVKCISTVKEFQERNKPRGKRRGGGKQ